MSIIERARHWWSGKPVVVTESSMPPMQGRTRGPVDHVIILDGTLSTLAPGMESNPGLVFKLLQEGGSSVHRTLYYEPGLQWEGLRKCLGIIQGRGINSQIRRAYGWLASHYRPGDRIFLFGYSRGAYAVRSLAGVIDRVGLLQREHATERAVRQAYRHYRMDPDSAASTAFSASYCYPETLVEMVGVWDTVKALGLRLPLLWMLTDKRNAFHNHNLGNTVKHGFQALAMHETRDAFSPVLWECPHGCNLNVEQAWFRGAHGDIGGQIGDLMAARGLSNIPLVWMLERAETVGLSLPEGWRAKFPCNPDAPMVGTIRKWGKIFLLRHKRKVGTDMSEQIHPSARSIKPKAGFWSPARFL